MAGTIRTAAQSRIPTAKLVVIAALSAVLFFLSLIPLEAIPEIPVDIDFKAFFVPMALIALLPRGWPALAVGVGAAMGEGIRDLIEGYEIDDPIGFVGYIIAFWLAGFLIRDRPNNKPLLFVATLFAGFFQYLIEGLALVAISGEAFGVYLVSLAGNTLTHGLLLGAIPVLFLVPALYGRIEPLLGFAPAERRREPDPAPPPPDDRGGSPILSPADRQSALVHVENFSFAYPAGEGHALRNVSFALHRGEVLGIFGPAGAGKSTLCMALAGLVPRITGGITWGEVMVAGRDPSTVPATELARQVGVVFEDPAAQMTALTVLDEVRAVPINRGVDPEEADELARAALRRVGLADDAQMTGRRMWEISGGEQQRVAIAATLVGDPDIVVFDDVGSALDSDGRCHVREIIADVARERTVVIVDHDPDELCEMADTLLALDGGLVVAYGEPGEVMRSTEMLEHIGAKPPISLRLAGVLGLERVPLALEEFERRLGTGDLRPRSPHTPRRGDGREARTDAPLRERSGAEHRIGEPLIEVEGVGFTYPDATRALEGVSLTVRAGEIHAVVGCNGAGKTTLSLLLSGLLTPSEGSVRFRGRDIGERTANELAHSIGIAFQNPDQQITEGRVGDELAFPLRRRRDGGSSGQRLSDGAIERRVDEVCERVGLDEAMLERDPQKLSLSERKLVTIAEALMLEPEVLVLDEPHSWLDPAARDRVTRAAEGLAEQGTAVVLFDHDIDLVAEIADAVTVLDRPHGIAAYGTPGEIFAPERWDGLHDVRLAPPRPARVARALGIEAVSYEGLFAKLAATQERA